ncbi:MAG: hypothetical protein ACTSV5_07325 [Promethearchaeota archaeon]
MNKMPHSGTHHYDGIFFLTSLLAGRRRRKHDGIKKSKLSRKQKQVGEKVESSKEIQEFETIGI